MRLAAFALAGVLGCTSTEVVPFNARMTLAQSTTGDTIRLPTQNGGVVEFGPNATLHLDGIDVPAGELYWNATGLYRKNGDFIAFWSDLHVIKVEQLDGAATVAVSATAAIAIVIVAALFKSMPGGSGGGSKGSGGGGGGGVKAPPVRSAPNPPSVPSDPMVSEVVFRTIEAISASSPSPSTPTATDDEEPDTNVAIPLFSRGSRRRANIRALARLEGGACWPGGGANTDCVVGGARVGMRIVDLIELTAGMRTETMGSTTRPLAVLGGMIHGESPSLHWLALAIGASVAFDGNLAHVVPTLAVRFSPMRGLWLGLVPIEPVYATDTGKWNMASGIEITGEL